ncbi:ComEB Deoxycytidylate deaminase [uncultured Caudovirales phage]|uniref:ComEB Deoxycytidylate deaminase n=1 Tax=uncultured Caudovirales phage TaxID=2100421 RepID=A0A6J5LFD8_9CAUD|nr:ComEB Deoxycytidylate deaminase [uncultured Caudovirales phage]
MKTKFVNAYMETAQTFANLSTAKRLKVGAIIVKEDRIISIGYNGMPSGWTNECEYEGVDNVTGAPRLITKDEVIHAEANAIAKLAKGTESGEGAIMFLTHSPCIQCAKQIYTSGIKKVFYRDKYSQEAGIEFLKKCNVEIEQWNIGDNTSS